MFDSSLWEKICKIKEFNGIPEPTCCLEVQKLNKSDRSPLTFVLTDFNVYFLTKNILKKSLSIHQTIKFQELKKLVLHEENKFSIHTSDTYTIISDYAKFIYKRMVSQCKSMFLLSEMPFFDDVNKIAGAIEPLPNTYLYRFKLLTQDLKHPPSKQFYTELESYVTMPKKDGELDLAGINDSGRFLKELLDSLPIAPSINTILIPKNTHSDKTYWKQIAKCLKTNTTLETIITEDNIDNDFQNIIEALSINPNSKLHGLIFLESGNLTKDLAIIVANVFSMRPFYRIGFYGGLLINAFEAFVQEASKYSLFKQLQRLELEKVVKGNPIETISSLEFIQELRITDCLCTMNDIVHMISKLPKLSKIHVNGLKPTDRIDSVSLTESVEELSITECKFNGKSLSDLWMILMNHRTLTTNFNLTFNSIKGDFEDLFHTMNTTPPSPQLKTFNWKKNLTAPDFFKALAAFPVIESCNFTQSLTAKSIEQFSDFVCRSRTLRKLVIDSRKKKGSIGDELCTFFKRVRGQTNITYFSCMQQDLTDKSLPDIANFLIDAKKLTSANFNGNLFMDKTVIKDFYEKIMHRGVPLEMPFISYDFVRMKKKGLMTDEDIDYIRECNTVLQQGVQVEQAHGPNSYADIPLDRFSSSAIFIEELNAENPPIEASSFIVPMGDPVDTLEPETDWSLVSVVIPPPDNTQPLREIADTYSYENIYAAFVAI